MASYIMPTSPVQLADYQAVIVSHVSNLLSLSESALELTSSFVTLGGNSITAIQLSKACKKQGIILSVPSILLSSSVLELVQQTEAPAAKVAVSVSSHARKSSLKPAAPTVHVAEVSETATPRSEEDARHVSFTSEPVAAGGDLLSKVTEILTAGQQESDAAMTEMQLLLVHGTTKEPGSNIIQFSETYTLTDLPAVRRAWEETILGEPDLHVELSIRGDGGVIVPRESEFIWNEVRTDNESDYKTEVNEKPTTTQVRTEFKVTILDGGWDCESVATVTWSTHHSLIDGYSAAIVYQKFQNALNGKRSKKSSSFTSVARQLRELQLERADESAKFWEELMIKHPDANGTIALPKPIAGRSAVAKLANTLSFHTSHQQMMAATRAIGCTPAALYAAAWALTLSRYAGVYSVVFGLVNSGRSLPLKGIEDAIGPLVNTLPLYVDIEPTQTVAELVRTVFKGMADVGEFQFARSADGFERKFSSAMAMQFSMGASEETTVRPQGASTLRLASDLPLSFCVYETGEVQIIYQASTFKEPDMRSLAKHFENACKLVTEPKRSVADCIDNFLTPATKQAVLKTSRYREPATSRGFSDETLVSLFQKTAANYPDLVAIERGSEKLTYRDVRSAVYRTANVLREHVAPGDIVCVHADRSVNWIVSMWAILVLGGTYAPIDPAFPPEARNTNFKTSGAKVFLTPAASQKELSPSACNNCMSIEELLLSAPAAFAPIEHVVAPADSAYVCFTSGSTGIPKAVLCHHEGLVAFQSTPEVRLWAAPGIRISQVMSPAFDGSIHEIFSAMCYGATLVLNASATDPTAHLSTVNSIIMTPTLAKAMDPEEYPYLQNVYLVGEPCPQKVCDEWAGIKRLYNMYGPTEATCGATIARLQVGRPVTIGPANPTSRVYIMDKMQKLLPPGVVGEICLAGLQVARGYIGREEETRAKFLMDTVQSESGEGLYRTGDFGYFTSDGHVMCLGRQDRQVKLRGFRMDLNDLEIRISAAVPEAELIAVTRQQDHLVCLIQPASVDPVAFRETIAPILGPQAMPRYIASVDKMPMTKIGKVDYAAIAKRDFTAGESKVRVPMTKTEVKLANIWREILSLPESFAIDPDMNFLTLGGHSILQLLLANRITSQLQCDLDSKHVFDSSTKASLKDLAQLVDSAAPTPAGMMSRSASTMTLGNSSLSPLEKGWFQRYALDDVNSQFNVSLAWSFEPNSVDCQRLVEAWNVVLDRHPIFKSKYHLKANGRPGRSFASTAPKAVFAEDFSMDEVVNEPFDLDGGALVRVAISNSQMILVACHIIVDLTAVRVVLNEVVRQYNGLPLEPLRRTYMQTSCWYEPTDHAALEFWNRHLEAPLRTRGVRLFAEPRPSAVGQSIIFDLGHALSQNISSAARAQRATRHHFALAAVSHALNASMGSEDILLGGPCMNREMDDQNVVGLFLEALPIVIPMGNDVAGSSEKLLRTVQESSQDALTHVMSWSKLMTHFGVEPNAPDNLLFDAMVTFNDEHMNEMLPIKGAKPLLTWAEGSKFRIMCEFTALANGGLMLRVEFMHDAYSREQILRFGDAIQQSLADLCQAKLAELADWTLDSDEPTRCHFDEGAETFAKPIYNLGRAD